MFGTLIANQQLKKLITNKEIEIDRFDKGSLKATHYTLHPGRVLTRSPEGKWYSTHDFKEKPERYLLGANDYVVVAIKERVRINVEGLVGRFMAVSTNIESGLLVVAGQIDSQYGVKNEALHVGVKNL